MEIPAFGSNQAAWGEAVAKPVTFVVTEDCQLRGRFCYFTGKNQKNRMEFEIARRTID